MHFRGYCSSAQSSLVILTLWYQSLYGWSEFPASTCTIPTRNSRRHSCPFPDVGKLLTPIFWDTAVFGSWYLTVLFGSGWRYQQVPSLKREIKVFHGCDGKSGKRVKCASTDIRVPQDDEKQSKLTNPTSSREGRSLLISFNCLLVEMLQFDSSGWVERALLLLPGWE